MKRKFARFHVTLLIDIGAFTSAEEDERITRLGSHLADLPLHLRVGKMLLYASLLGVLDPILTIACAGYRPQSSNVFCRRRRFHVPLPSFDRLKYSKRYYSVLCNLEGERYNLKMTTFKSIK
jgi:HrpA-like RNA helicase